jgi:hypothetical protein
MTATRQKATNSRSVSASRKAAIASIQINWKKISPDGDRDERLAWIAAFLGIRSLDSLTDLSDAQLGAVAGEMKRLTGTPASVPARHAAFERIVSRDTPNRDNVVSCEFGRPDSQTAGTRRTIHLASHEQVYTLTKLQSYLEWDEAAVQAFINKRLLRDKFNFGTFTFRRLTFKQATNALLHIAAHRDLKRHTPPRPETPYPGRPGRPRRHKQIIPELKNMLGTDQRR